MIDIGLNGKPSIRCNWCGAEIDGGFVADNGNAHYCDECAEELLWHARSLGEFRTCDRCGAVMTQGFCDENIDHICEDCFDSWMDEVCPGGWRMNEHDGERLWDGGYYDELVDGEWVDTGIYWTKWE